jgi:hypothetical protein
MAGIVDRTTMFTDFMGVVPFDTKAFEDAFKDSVSFNEKLARVAVATAGKKQMYPQNGQKIL